MQTMPKLYYKISCCVALERWSITSVWTVDAAAGNGRFISRLRAKGERAVEGGIALMFAMMPEPDKFG